MEKAISEDEKEELYKDLKALKKELEKLILQAKEMAKPVDLEEPIGRLSRMDDMQRQSMAQANKDKLILRSRQVDASLNDYKSGRYGMCRKCNQSIGFSRLKAKPEAPFCLKCQDVIESKLRAAK